MRLEHIVQKYLTSKAWPINMLRASRRIILNALPNSSRVHWGKRLSCKLQRYSSSVRSCLLLGNRNDGIWKLPQSFRNFTRSTTTSARERTSKLLQHGAEVCPQRLRQSVQGFRGTMRLPFGTSSVSRRSKRYRQPTNACISLTLG